MGEKDSTPALTFTFTTPAHDDAHIDENTYETDEDPFREDVIKTETLDIDASSDEDVPDIRRVESSRIIDERKVR